MLSVSITLYFVNVSTKLIFYLNICCTNVKINAFFCSDQIIAIGIWRLMVDYCPYAVKKNASKCMLDSTHCCTMLYSLLIYWTDMINVNFICLWCTFWQHNKGLLSVTTVCCFILKYFWISHRSPRIKRETFWWKW